MQETRVRSLSREDPLEKGDSPLQYSCLGNLMDGGAWWATVRGIAKELEHDLVTKNSNNSLQANIDLINLTSKFILKCQNDHSTSTVHALAR